MAINLTGLNPLRHLSCVSAAQALSVVNPNWHHSAQGLLFFLPLFICPFSSTISHRLKQTFSKILACTRSQTLPPRSRCTLPSLPYFAFIYTKTLFSSVTLLGNEWQKENKRCIQYHQVPCVRLFQERSALRQLSLHQKSARKHLQKQIIFYDRL